MGCESPAITVGVCTEVFVSVGVKSVIGKLRRQDAKMRIFLYGTSHKTCFDVILLTFSYEAPVNFPGLCLVWIVICHRNTQLW